MRIEQKVVDTFQQYADLQASALEKRDEFHTFARNLIRASNKALKDTDGPTFSMQNMKVFSDGDVVVYKEPSQNDVDQVKAHFAKEVEDGTKKQNPQFEANTFMLGFGVKSTKDGTLRATCYVWDTPVARLTFAEDLSTKLSVRRDGSKHTNFAARFTDDMANIFASWVFLQIPDEHKPAFIQALEEADLVDYDTGRPGFDIGAGTQI